MKIFLELGREKIISHQVTERMVDTSRKSISYKLISSFGEFNCEILINASRDKGLFTYDISQKLGADLPPPYQPKS